MFAARSTISKVTALQSLGSALQLNISIEEDHHKSIGSDFLLYQERSVNEWVGPQKVLAGNNKNKLLSVNGRIFPESVDDVKH